MILESALLCMAMNLYRESRSETIMGQHAVAQVTFNRAGRDPKNVCKVVAAPKQFSWTNKSYGFVRRANGKLSMTTKGLPLDDHAWQVAKKIAVVTLNGRMYDFTHGANHYHADYVRPAWKSQMVRVATYGHHLFYRYNT